ncbi:hypothetical protein Tco_1240947 [Tanacetum coccineum]
MVEKQIQEDRGRQLAIMNIGHQFDNAITAKDELRKAYEECRYIPLGQRALSEKFLKIESELDQQMQNALFRKAAKLEKQIKDKNKWLQQLLPRESIRIKRPGQAVIDGKIFWIGSERFYSDDGISYKIYMIVPFDLVTHQLHVQDMPEQIGAWELEVEGGFVSSCSLLFTIPHTAGHYLKLLGFSKDNQPMMEATIVQQCLSTLHFLMFLRDGFEVLKVVENSLEVLKVLENNL